MPVKISLNSFDGKDADWPQWRFNLRNYLAFHNLADVVSPGVDDVLGSDATPAQQREAYAAICAALTGEAVFVAETAPLFSGTGVFKALQDRFEPARLARKFGLLEEVLSPTIQMKSSFMV